MNLLNSFQTTPLLDINTSVTPKHRCLLHRRAVKKKKEYDTQEYSATGGGVKINRECSSLANLTWTLLVFTQLWVPRPGENENEIPKGWGKGLQGHLRATWESSPEIHLEDTMGRGGNGPCYTDVDNEPLPGICKHSDLVNYFPEEIISWRCCLIPRIANGWHK